MEKTLISVIVPVYDVEQYLPECIESILDQTYNQLEIILVDDGSDDHGGSICDEYRLKDSRIKVIHKKNGGLSDARNAGLDICKGEYISFIDSDDYVSPYFMEILFNAVQLYDCEIAALTGGVDFWDGDGEKAELAKSNIDYAAESKTSVEVLELMLYQKIATGAQYKLFQRQIFDSIRFPKGYLYEDVATTYKTFLSAKKAAVIESKLYAYRKRKNSIIRQEFNQKKLAALDIFDWLIADEGLSKCGLSNAAVSRAYAMLFSVFLQIPKENREVKRKVWKKLKEGRASIIHNRVSLMRKKNRYAALISYLGMTPAYILGRTFGQKGSMNR